MEFRLTYRGPLKSKSSTTKEQTQKLRRHFHQQLAVLWDSAALVEARKYVDATRSTESGEINLIQSVGAFQFALIASQAHGWNTVAELEIIFLRPSESCELIQHGGDLDNRVKTLLDGLRTPSVNEIPSGDRPASGETPFFCPLQDDALVTDLAIRTDRLLTPATNNEVELIIRTRIRATRKSMGSDMVW
jgi:hypothetical protein